MLLHCLFVISSVALTRSRLGRIRELDGNTLPRAGLARLLIKEAEHHLLAMHLGIFGSALVAGFTTYAFGSLASAAIFGSSPESLFVKAPLFEVVLLLTVTLSALFFSQMGKALALRDPERMLCRIALIVMIFSKGLSPFAAVLGRGVRGFLGLFHIDAPLERELAISAEDLSDMVNKSSQAGELEEDTRELIQGVFSFSDKVVREVMTPRSDIISIPIDASLQELLELFSKEGVSRVIVRGEDIDEVKGIILMKDLVPFVGREVVDFSIARVMRPACFVPTSKKVDDLLEEFRRAALHFAVVLNEHGGVDGVVTLEDIIEEIVGDIFDEHDRPSEELGVRRTKSGDLIVSGGMPTSDMPARTNLTLPEGDYDTLAGFIITHLGRFPKVGEIIEYRGSRIRVESIINNRITLVRLIKPRTSNTLKSLIKDSSESSPASKDSNREGERSVPPALVSNAK